MSFTHVASLLCFVGVIIGAPLAFLIMLAKGMD